MQRLGRFGWLTLVALLAFGCGKQAPRDIDVEEPAEPRQLVQTPSRPPQFQTLGQPQANPGVFPVATVDPGLQERYDDALLDALNLLADQKLAEALAALDSARQILDTEQIRQQIATLQIRLDQQAAAERTAQDIQVVLASGKADDAARLANLALQQYGATDAAATLARLKRQADAVVSVQLGDGAARKQRFRLEAETAVRDKNLRAAYLALDQALLQGDDAALRRQRDDLQVTLTRYDDNRRRAAELRRDPWQLEDAVAALEDAARAWDTPEIQQELDEYRLALQKRRDRISVADFEIRGNSAAGLDGRTIAEELLPTFKGRFDLVERTQLEKIIEELKLQGSDLIDDDDAQRQVGQLARARFLVLGSVSALGGLTVHARLVDVRTGLVVQTAKVAARTSAELLALLPQLSQVLQMSDEQKLAYEQQLIQQAPPLAAPVVAAPVPPPPVAGNEPPPPIFTHSPRPPAFGTIAPQDFDRLAPPPAGPPPVVVVDRPEPVREKLLSVAVQLGDNLYLRGRYQEAFAQFDLALNLAPDHRDLRIRIERCRPHLPPPVVVVTPPVFRPRLAVLDFVIAGDPRIVPPPLGGWVAEGLAPYLCPPYDVVDRGEVFWYMSRLGMTMADLLNDPGARRWLGRALNVRYFLFGTIRQGPGLEVTTHLVDAEHGYLQGAGRIVVSQVPELKCRLGELARLTLLSPAERALYERQIAQCQAFLLDARRCCNGGQFALAIDFCKKGLALRPDHVEIRVLLQQSEAGLRQAAFEEARRREWERQQALALEYQRRQQSLVLAVEAVRVRPGSAVAVGIGVQVRDRAGQDLQVQGRLALQQGNFGLSIQFFESAVGLQPSDDGYRELAQARARAAEAAQTRAAAEQVRLAEQQRLQAAAEQARLEQDRRRKQAEAKARRDAQAAHDLAEYTRLLDQAQRQLAQEKFQPAIAALQTARQLNKTDEVERLLSQALVEQARASAQQKGAAERADLEQELAEEKVARDKAEKESQRNRELYQQALERGKKALDGQQYDDAVAAYEDAGKLYRSDVVLTGLRQAEQGRSRKLAQTQEIQRKKQAEARRVAALEDLKKDGQAALAAQQFAQAVEAFRKARDLAPADVDVLAALSKAEQAQANQAAQARAKKEDLQRQATFRTMMDSARTNRTAKRYAAAVGAVREALKIEPGDAQAQALLKEVEAEQAVAGNAAARAEAQKKTEEYQQRMREGRLALDADRFDAAIAAFQAAQKVLPGDEASAALLKEAQAGKAEVARKVADEARKRKEELQTKADVQKHLKKGRFALFQRDLRTAALEIDAAALLAPDDAEVKKAKEDLRKLDEQVKAEGAERQKQLEEFQRQFQRAQDLMIALQFQEALLALAQAQQLNPSDPRLADLIKEAEKGKAASQASAQDVARARQLVAQARALMVTDLNAAAQLLTQAAQLAPKDAQVLKAQDDLRDARQSAAAGEKKRQADYDAALKLGRDALTARRFDEAIKFFARASQLKPNDDVAAALLRKAQQGREDALADAAKKQDAQKDAEVKRLVTQGRAAMQAKRYDDAIKLFSAAVKLDPKDPAAARGLEDAREEVKGQAGKQAEYGKHMKAGANLEQQGRFQDAVRSYQDALRVQPGDAAAQTAIRRAEFAYYMGEGRRALNSKRFAEAERAFLEALQRNPGHPEATKGLQAARQGKK